MRVLFFSMTPLFPNYAMGGAQKQLRLVALHLAKMGHEVTVLCTQRSDALESFRWEDRVQVIPLFRFKQPYPEPYATPAYNIAAAVQDVSDYMDRADVFYIADGGLIFPFVYLAHRIPTVVSLRSVVYSETIQAGFLFQADKLILISEHERRFYEDTAGRFSPDYAARVQVIPNGFDWSLYNPTISNQQIRQIVDVDRTQYPVLLHPHRPEPDKGLQQTIELVTLLVHQYGFKNLITLVPQWLDTTLSPEVRGFYERAQEQIRERGLSSNFLFHGWIPEALMPEYYTLGTATLCLGSFVETFGNVPYESMGCGTPAIVARVGPHRDNLPDALVDKVDFDDAEAAASAAARIIRTGERTMPQTMQYLHTHFSIENMMAQYADAILGAAKLGGLRYENRPISAATHWRLAHWCYASLSRGIYHDFRADYARIPALEALVGRAFSFADAEAKGADRDEVLAWYRDGYIVPVW
jgi:glycosyltransferase involved in cell wall biosynthesis